MSAEIFQQILKDHQELSSLPQTLAEVLTILRDEDSSANQLASVIKRDPALATKILRAANSPYYGGREITNITQAVMTMGMRAVSSLALSTSVYDMTGKWELTVDRCRFWRHSLEVALACRDLADLVKYRYPEEAFVCGLLHDIGILVMEKSFPDKFQRIWRRVQSGENLADLEDEIWGTNHARVGQFLLEQWKIPSVICEAVGMHHSGMLTQTNDPEFIVARIVGLANRVSRMTVAPNRPETDADLEDKDTLSKALKIDEAKLTELELHLMPKTIEEARFLEINLGSPEEILTEANRMIYQNYLTVENLLRENRKMQQELARSQMEKAALDSLRTIAATFNHYINNAASTIIGRAQLVELRINRGEIIDLSGDIARSMQTIIRGVNALSSVLDELKDLTSFQTTLYQDDTYIVNLEKRLEEELEELKAEPVEAPQPDK